MNEPIVAIHVDGSESTLDIGETEHEPFEEPPKKRRGRPPGIKNRTRVSGGPTGQVDKTAQKDVHDMVLAGVMFANLFLPEPARMRSSEADAIFSPLERIMLRHIPVGPDGINPDYIDLIRCLYAVGIYGERIGAFSGRNNRPNKIVSPQQARVQENTIDTNNTGHISESRGAYSGDIEARFALLKQSLTPNGFSPDGRSNVSAS